MLGHVIFDGYDFGEDFFCHADRPLLPSITAIEQPRPMRFGAKYLRREVSPIEIPVIMVLREPKQDSEYMRSVIDNVVKHLQAESAELYLPYADNRHYLASVAGTSSVQEFVTTAKLSVVFRASDPRMRGENRQLAIDDRTNHRVDLGGNTPSRGVFTAKTVADTDFIRLTNKTKELKVEVRPVGGGQWSGGRNVRMDFDREMAYVNDSPYPVTLDSNFYELSDLDVLYAYNVTNAKIEWTELWL